MLFLLSKDAVPEQFVLALSYCDVGFHCSPSNTVELRYNDTFAYKLLLRAHAILRASQASNKEWELP